MKPSLMTMFISGMVGFFIFFLGFIYVLIDKQKEEPVHTMPPRPWVIISKRQGEHLSMDFYYTMKDKHGKTFGTSFQSEYNVGDTIK